MDRIWQANASPNPPTLPSSASMGFPRSGGAGPATVPGAYWFYMMTSELMHVIEDGGLDPDAGELTQVRDAIRTMIAESRRFVAAGAGSVPRTTVQKLSEAMVSLQDKGGVLDGVADCSAALIAACQSLAPGGGAVLITGPTRIAQNVTIPSNVTVRSHVRMVGTPGSNVSAAFDAILPALIIDAGVSLTLGSSAGVQGLMVRRAGMTFPAADTSDYAGTPIMLGGDDCFVVDSMILGFARAIYGTGKQRPRLQNINIDCLSGIEVDYCADIARINDVHCWPFATIGAGGGPLTYHRSGTAFNFSSLGDWCKLTNCFSYGYYRGFVNDSCNSMTYLGCGADGTGLYAGSIGFSALGGSTDTHWLRCQSAANEIGYYSNTFDGLHTGMTASDAWFNSGHAVLVGGGDLAINASMLRNSPYGVTVTSPNSRVGVSARFKDIALAPINPTVPTSRIRINSGCDFGNFPSAVVSSNLVPLSVASGSAIALDNSCDEFNITGIAAIGTINGGWAGRVVMLYFAAAASVLNSTGATNAVRLGGSATFNAAAGSALTLRHNGVQWFEIGRCA